MPPLLLAVLAAPRVLEAAVRSSYATLGRDQGIFQYVAWAIGKGEIAYRDVRDVNGPLVPLLHLVMQSLGGTDERTFRILDLAFSALAFAFVGACLVDLDEDDERAPLLERASWALAAVFALGAQYLAYGYWDTAQRESFFDWFVLVGVSAGITGQRALAQVARGARAEGRAFAWLALSGAASATTVLGKPTYALFAVAQMIALVLDTVPIRIGRRLAPFVVGAVVGLAVPFAFLVLRGDVAAWARITFSDVPAMYRFIWPRPIAHLFEMGGYAKTIGLALAATVSIVGLVAIRLLPRRALALGLVPLFGFASVVAQAKGFPYHFHPVSAGTTVAFLAVLRMLASSEAATKVGLGKAASAVALLVAIALGVRARASLGAMPWPAFEGPRESDAHLAPYVRIDFFPIELRRAAELVQRITREDDRVQTYGMDAYVLFLARRLSATPYIYAYDLNVDAALAGASVFGGAPPTPAERARIQAMRDEHERDMLERLEAKPPAVFMFLDRSPLMASADALADFQAHCPETAAWVLAHYREERDFDGIHVWVRADASP